MIWLKRGFSALALGIALYLFWPLLGQMRATGTMFRSAHWAWLPVALGVQAISYASLTWLNFLALKPFPGRIGFGRLAALLTSIAFIEVAIPSAGGSGLVLRVRLLGKHGSYSAEAATLTVGLEAVVLSAVMASVAVLGVVYLFHKGDLRPGQIFLLIGIGLTGILALWLGWRTMTNPQRSRRILARLLDSWNSFAVRIRSPRVQSPPLPGILPGFWDRLIHPIDLSLLDDRLGQFQASLALLRDGSAWKFLVAGVGRVVFDVATLGACFRLFGQIISPAVLLTGYGLILAGSGLAAVPGGLGLADLSIPGLFLLLGVPGPVALAAGLTYRLIAFWLVRLVGFFSWQTLESRA